MMRSDSPWTRTNPGKDARRSGGAASSNPGPTSTATTRSHAMRCAGSSGSTARSPPSPKRPPSITPGGKYTGSAQVAYSASPSGTPRPPAPHSVSPPVSRAVGATERGARTAANRAESPIHCPAGAPLRGSIVPALLVGRLGDDRRHLGWLALIVERDVCQITRVGVPLHSRERILGDDLDPHLHRRLAGEVHAPVRGEQLPHVDRLAEVDLVDRDGDALAAGGADRGRGA